MKLAKAASLLFVVLGAVACGDDNGSTNNSPSSEAGVYLTACNQYCDDQAAAKCDPNLTAADCKSLCEGMASGAVGDCATKLNAVGTCFKGVADVCAADNCTAENSAAQTACEE